MTFVSLLLFLCVWWCDAAVLFDQSDLRDFALVVPTNASVLEKQYFIPPGVLVFSAKGQPNVSDVVSAVGGRFTAISAPVRRIDRMPVAVANETITIDVDYRFSLREPLMRGAEIGHGLGQYVLLSSDDDSGQDPRGLVFEYGGGSLAPFDGTGSNWSEPRVSAWRFHTVDSNGLGSWPTQWTPTALRARLIRQGSFRILARFEVQRNASTGAGTMSFIQSRVFVEGNANFSGILVDYASRMTQWQMANASRWLQRDTSNPPRIVLFASKTDFLVEDVRISAELKSLAPSFNSSWLAPPPTNAPPTTTAASTTRLSTTTTTTTTATTNRVPATALPTVVTGNTNRPPTAIPQTTLSVLVADTTGPATTVASSVNSFTGNVSVVASTPVTTKSQQSLTQTLPTLVSSLQSESDSLPVDAGGTTAPEQVVDGGQIDPGVVVGVLVAAVAIVCIVVAGAVCAVHRRNSADGGKHTSARVLAISPDEMYSARADQNSIRKDSIYGPAPAQMHHEYELVDPRALTPHRDLSAIYTAAPAYDRVGDIARGNIYDSATSPLV
jgi:hypothetical protein